MAIIAKENFLHWNYYIALEEDLSKISRYIEFSEDNFNVYSIELAHLLLAASSEIDVVLKALCNIINPSKKHKNINDYQRTIKDKLSNLINEPCYIHRYGLELNPSTNWNNDENPHWWKDYNDVKHERDINFNKANLKNTLNALSALNLTIIYYYKAFYEKVGKSLKFKEVTTKLEPKPSLIKANSDYYYDNLVV